MKLYWTIPVLLSLTLAVACADNARDNAENTETPAVEAPADDPAEPNVPNTPVDRPEPEPAPAREDTSAGRGTGRSAARAPASTAPPAGDTAPRAQAAPANEWRELTIPQGTALPLELETPLSSETSQVETPVRARLREAVFVDGFRALPAGAVLTGEVIDVARAGRVKGRSRLAFTFIEVQAGSVRESLKTNPLTYVGEASKGEDATKIGAGAVGGAIVGGILGGGDAAAKGAVIGGAAGTGVVLATRGEDVTLAKGANLAASLAEPLRLRVQVK